MHAGKGPDVCLTQVLGCHKTPALVLLPLHCLQMHTNTKNYTTGSAAFFPGEVIILWVDCMSLYSGRPLLNMGLTKHFSILQWVSVSLHRNTRPYLKSRFSHCKEDNQTNSMFLLSVLSSCIFMWLPKHPTKMNSHFKENNLPKQIAL